MRNVCIVVEGETEKQFVSLVLVPMARTRGVYLQPIVVPTSSTGTAVHKGGGSSWRHYRQLVDRLVNQPHWTRIGVMFDLYACPRDTPGFDESLKGIPLHAAVTLAANQVFEDRGGRVLVGPVLHELETLVIAAIATGATEAEANVVRQATAAINKADGEVERVNGSPAGAPSKRLSAWWPGYEKVLYGAVLLDEAPWDEIARQCPTFAKWWDALLAEP